jgi:hypothetical protein
MGGFAFHPSAPNQKTHPTKIPLRVGGEGSCGWGYLLNRPDACGRTGAAFLCEELSVRPAQIFCLFMRICRQNQHFIKYAVYNPG